MSPRILGAIAAIVVLGGGGVAFVMLRSAGEAEEALSKLLRAVNAELDADELDRDALSDVLKAVDQRRLEAPGPKLTQAKARLQLALGRTAAAWETISDVATGPEATFDDRWVGARVAARLHAERGESHVGSQAMSLCRECAEESEATVDVAFLLWQVAYRTNSVSEWLDAYDQLQAGDADTLEARTAKSIGYFLAFHIADQLGIAGDAEQLAKLAKDPNTDAEVRGLCEFIVSHAEASKAVTEQDLNRLDVQWGGGPPELAVLLARAEIAKASQPDGRRDQAQNAAEILKGVLERYPTYVEARHLIAAAHYALHEFTAQKAHVRWLLENAPETDTRRAAWHNQL